MYAPKTYVKCSKRKLGNFVSNAFLFTFTAYKKRLALIPPKWPLPPHQPQSISCLQEHNVNFIVEQFPLNCSIKIATPYFKDSVNVLSVKLIFCPF
jgi:hypothetical protein